MYKVTNVLHAAHCVNVFSRLAKMKCIWQRIPGKANKIIKNRETTGSFSCRMEQPITHRGAG